MQMKISEVCGFHTWARLALDNASISFEDANWRMDWFGKNDGRYLVLNCRLGHETEYEYTFLPMQEGRDHLRLIDIFESLREFEYSLSNILIYLERVEFDLNEIGSRVDLPPISVTRHFIKGKYISRS
ncbi:hypothetical protein V8J88_22155 [Massilia sp. W12]|uniref:hypothetical protein n=1 Tax=Massilia sp. W12 TaxID=3126507 RepID=UPI0030D43D46